MNLKKYKILIIGCTSDKNSIELKYYRAIKKNKNFSVRILKNEIHNFCKIKIIQRYFEIFFYYYYSFKLKNFFKKNRNKYNYVLIFKGLFYDKESIRRIKKFSPNTIFANIDGDDPFNIDVPSISNKKHIISLTAYDLIFFWSEKIKNKFIKNFPQQVKKSKILYFGYENKNKITVRKFNPYFVFYGSWDSKRERFLNSLKIDNLNIYGNGWNACSNKFKFRNNIYSEISGKKLTKVIYSSLGIINLFRKQNNDQINMRIFEVLGAGGLLITKQSRLLKKIFKGSKIFLQFNNIKQCNSILNLINNNVRMNYYFFDYRKKAQNALKIHTYDHRFKEILNYTTFNINQYN